jgi:hypothetical protein
MPAIRRLNAADGRRGLGAHRLRHFHQRDEGHEAGPHFPRRSQDSFETLQIGMLAVIEFYYSFSFLLTVISLQYFYFF